MQLDIASKADFIRLEKTVEKILDIIGGERPSPGEWMKSAEAKKVLKCSDSSLKNYRSKGLIQFTKIAGTYYYKPLKIEDYGTV